MQFFPINEKKVDRDWVGWNKQRIQPLNKKLVSLPPQKEQESKSR